MKAESGTISNKQYFEEKYLNKLLLEILHLSKSKIDFCNANIEKKIQMKNVSVIPNIS